MNKKSSKDNYMYSNKWLYLLPSSWSLYSVIDSCCLLLRYDYENVDIDAACEMMEDLEIMISDKSFVKQRFAVEDKIYQVEKADNFEYTDPVDSTITRNQVHDTHWAVFLSGFYVSSGHDVLEQILKASQSLYWAFFHCRACG